MANVKNTNVSMFSKVSSLGARFFEKYVSTKAMNKKLTEINNLGLTEIITATAASATTDFGTLKVGDFVVVIDHTSAGKAQCLPVASAATSPITPAVGNVCLVIAPSN